MTIVCGDSHTATHGAFGALAFGIGTSEVEHVLATFHTQIANGFAAEFDDMAGTAGATGFTNDCQHNIFFPYRDPWRIRRAGIRYWHL
jgi:hypothetical protein